MLEVRGERFVFASAFLRGVGLHAVLGMPGRLRSFPLLHRGRFSRVMAIERVMVIVSYPFWRTSPSILSASVPAPAWFHLQVLSISVSPWVVLRRPATSK